MEKKKIIFLFPGKEFKTEFVNSLIRMLHLPPPEGLRACGVTFAYNIEYSSDIYACRNNLVRTHPHTLNQSRKKVLDGYEYDYMVWIDSDQEWTGQDVLSLIEHDVDVVTGVIPIAGNQRTCIGKYRVEDGKPQISYYKFRSLLEEERNEKGLVPIDFCGFGFIAMKRGVMERIGYPWFQTVIHDWDDYEFFLDGVMQEKRASIKIATSEDIGWCSRAKKLGIQIYADPEVRIGHRKEVLLRAKNYEYEVKHKAV